MTHGSLSTGICGFDIGAELNGIETKWTCEIDPLRRDIIKWLLPNARHYTDMRKVKAPLPVDIISFGFPCQDISNANPYGKGIHGKKSSLWNVGWSIIRKLGPRYAIMENSPNLTNRGLEFILWQISNDGYNAEWYPISCQRFGLPHIRKRIFIVAYPKEIGVDTEQILDRSAVKKHSTKEKTTLGEMEVWARSRGVHSTSFWSKVLADFHHLDTRLPPNIYNGLVAAAGDTVSPRITSWIFSRIKAIEEEKEKTS